MDINEAKQKLDHVISISRVEMYKPIQVAEVLYRARQDKAVELTKVETYRVKSRQWRDDVTLELFNKRSTSSARFQDDLWNDTAVPPDAMSALGRANSGNKVVEAYIYHFVAEKNRALASARTTLSNLQTSDELQDVLDRHARAAEFDRQLHRDVEHAGDVLLDLADGCMGLGVVLPQRAALRGRRRLDAALLFERLRPVELGIAHAAGTGRVAALREGLFFIGHSNLPASRIRHRAGSGRPGWRISRCVCRTGIRRSARRRCARSRNAAGRAR